MKITLKNEEVIETNDSITLTIQYAITTGFMNNNVIVIKEIN